MSYEGPLPDIKYHGADTVSPENRKKFMAWYTKKKQEGYVFVFIDECDAYCVIDVRILERGFTIFQKLFKKVSNGIDPIDKCITIASACSLVFRKVFLEQRMIAIVPPRGYRFNEVQSLEAVEWLNYVAHCEKTTLHAKNSAKEAVVCGLKVDGFKSGAPGSVYEYHGFVHRRKLSGTACERAGISFLKPGEAFYGGRTNAACFHAKTDVEAGETIEYVDITSLYPWTNKYSLHPVAHPQVIVDDFEDIQSYFGLAKCKILPPRGLYHPVLACRQQHKCNHSDEERFFVGTWQKSSGWPDWMTDDKLSPVERAKNVEGQKELQSEVRSLEENLEKNVLLLESRLEKLEKKNKDLESKVVEFQRDADEPIKYITQKLKATEGLVEELQLKSNKLERFSRRNNIRIIGLHRKVIERAHPDGPKSRSDGDETPQHILFKLNSYQDKINIMKVARVKLKNEGYYFTDDLTLTDLQEKRKWRDQRNATVHNYATHIALASMVPAAFALVINMARKYEKGDINGQGNKREVKQGLFQHLRGRPSEEQEQWLQSLSDGMSISEFKKGLKERMQNKVGKLILGLQPRTSSAEVHLLLGWRDVATTHKTHKLLAVYKSLNGMMPSHRKELFATCQDSSTRITRQATSNKLLVPRVSRDCVRRSFAVSGAKDYEIVSPECGELRILRYNSGRHDSTSMIFGRQITVVEAEVKYKFRLQVFKLMCCCLIVLVSNAEAERVFSCQNRIKTKTRQQPGHAPQPNPTPPSPPSESSVGLGQMQSLGLQQPIPDGITTPLPTTPQMLPQLLPPLEPSLRR
ncbi:hypothetical protein Bbelb_283600 [Branchiostoma belcheri]|nr:hypothetical protein Bbelb_283600 [Branchiostoma belcheri]